MPESPSSNQENTIDLAWIENVLWSVRPERSSETQQCIDQLIEQLALDNVDADQLAEQVVNSLNALQSSTKKSDAQIVPVTEFKSDDPKTSILSAIKANHALNSANDEINSQSNDTDEARAKIAQHKKRDWINQTFNPPPPTPITRFFNSIAQWVSKIRGHRVAPASDVNQALQARVEAGEWEDNTYEASAIIKQRLSDIRKSQQQAQLSEKLSTLSNEVVRTGLDQLIDQDNLEQADLSAVSQLSGIDAQSLQKVLCERIIQVEEKKSHRSMGQSQQRHQRNIAVVKQIAEIKKPTVADLQLLARIDGYQEQQEKNLDLSRLAFALTAKDALRESPEDSFIDDAGYREAMTTNRRQMMRYLDQACSEQALNGDHNTHYAVLDLATRNDQPLADNRTVTVGLAASAEVEAQYTDLKMRSLIEDLLDPTESHQQFNRIDMPLDPRVKSDVVTAYQGLMNGALTQSEPVTDEQFSNWLQQFNEEQVKKGAHSITPAQMKSQMQEIARLGSREKAENKQLNNEQIFDKIKANYDQQAENYQAPQQLVCGQIRCDASGKPDVRVAMGASGYRTCCVPFYDVTDKAVKGPDSMNVRISKLIEGTLSEQPWSGENLEECITHNKLTTAMAHAGGPQALFDNVANGEINIKSLGRYELNGDLKLDNILVNPANGVVTVIDNNYEADEMPVGLDQGMLIDIAGPVYGSAYFGQALSSKPEGVLQRMLEVRQEPSSVALDAQLAVQKQMDEQLQTWIKDTNLAKNMGDGLMCQRLWLGPSQTMHDAYALCTVGQVLATEYLSKNPNDPDAEALRDNCQIQQREMLEALANQSLLGESNLPPQYQVATIAGLIQYADYALSDPGLSKDEAVARGIEKFLQDPEERGQFINRVNEALNQAQESAGLAEGPETEDLDTVLNDKSCQAFLKTVLATREPINRFNQQYTVDQVKQQLATRKEQLQASVDQLELQAPSSSENRVSNLGKDFEGHMKAGETMVKRKLTQSAQSSKEIKKKQGPGIRSQ